MGKVYAYRLKGREQIGDAQRVYLFKPDTERIYLYDEKTRTEVVLSQRLSKHIRGLKAKRSKCLVPFVIQGYVTRWKTL